MSAETIAYLKWLIFVALFKDSSHRDKTDGTEWDHSKYYAMELATLNDPGNTRWRALLRRVLQKWYTAHPSKPAGKRRSSSGTDQYNKIQAKKQFLDDFVESDDDARPTVDAGAVAALAAAAAAAAVEGGSGGSGGST